MSALPVIIDCQPAYLAGSAQTLLQMPLGTGTVLTYLRERLGLEAEITVLTTSPVHPTYERTLRQDLPDLRGIYPIRRLGTLLTELEPADWLLFVDAARFPTDGGQLDQLSRQACKTRTVTFGVARETAANTAQERVLLDQQGNVQRIQRFYPGVTRMSSGHVSFALIPAAVAFTACDKPVESLGELRRAVADHAIPSQDIELSAGAANLSWQRGFLRFSEGVVHELVHGNAPESYTKPAAGILVGPGCRLDPTARIYGPVLLQPGVSLGAGSAVIGPAVLGAGSRVLEKACVAQCVLGQDAEVVSGSTLRQHITTRGESCGKATPSAPGHTACHHEPGGETVPSTPNVAAPRRWYPPIKRVVESLLAATGLGLLSVPLLVTAALVKLTSRGPVLFGHVREGKNGREFQCWKFRTMIQNAHALQRALYKQNKVDGPQFKLDHDPRITPVGRVLRTTNIDELPQLINVALGHMSLIGPRPSPFRENQICVPWRRARLSVRPGITGLWQICRNNRAAGDFHQWIYFDMLYVKHMSPMLDLKIMLATLFTFAGRFSVPLHWMIASHKLEALGFSERPRRAPILEKSVGEPVLVGAETQ